MKRLIVSIFNSLRKYLLFRYCHDGKRVTLSEFSDFLQDEQLEVVEASPVAERMRNFLQDPARDVAEPYFTLSEFLDWLFSKV